MQIFVKLYPSGKTITLEVSGDDTIADLKDKLLDKAGIEPSQQKLVYKGKPLGDEAKTLKSYDINKEAKINLTCADYNETFEEGLAMGKARDYSSATARTSTSSSDMDKLYKELQQLETSDLANVDLFQWDTQIAGTWHLDYQDNPTKTELKLRSNGTFLQVVGNYEGVWRTEGQLLVLDYVKLHYPGNPKSIKLQCELNEKMNVFRGCKTNSGYAKGRLLYIGERLSSE